MMDWKREAENDYSLMLADGVWINVYLPRFPFHLSAKWKWGVYGVGQDAVGRQDAGGRVDTEAEAKAAAIANARAIITAKRDELDNALATLNAAATLEPTP